MKKLFLTCILIILIFSYISDSKDVNGNTRKNPTTSNIKDVVSTISPLTVTSANWGKVRINRPKFPSGPYPVPVGQEAIKFYNFGSERVTLTDVLLNVISGDGNSFIFDRLSFINLIINAQDSVLIPVTFQPDICGEHHIRLSFLNSANQSNVNSDLIGFGVLPKLFTHGYDFGRTVPYDFVNMVTKKIAFKNLDYEWADTVTISDFVDDPPGSVLGGINGTNFGTGGFRYNKAAICLPVKIAPGDSLAFDAEYVSTKLRNDTARITTVSDAEKEVTSVWNGQGVTEVYENPFINNNLEIYSETFSNSLRYKFRLGQAAEALITINDISGISVKNIDVFNCNDGVTQGTVNISDLQSGSYFCTLKTNKFSETKKFVVIR